MLIRISNIISYLIKGIILKLFYHKHIRVSGIGRVSFHANLSAINGGRIVIEHGARISKNVHLIANGGTIVLGNDVGINQNVIISSHEYVSIGSETLFAPNVCIYDHNHKFDINGLKEGYSAGDVTIGRKCWIGVNVTILKNTHIGDGCIIGAGCVVSGEIPAHSIVTGNRDNVVIPIQ